MKDFFEGLWAVLEGLWVLFVLVVIISSVCLKYHANRHPEPPRTYKVPANWNKPMELPKWSGPTFGTFPAPSKLPTRERFPIATAPRPEAPMPRAKLESAPPPRAKTETSPASHSGS